VGRDRQQPRQLRYLLLALLQLFGGLFLLAFVAFPTPTSPRGLDLVLGSASIGLAAMSWFRLHRMAPWALHVSLAGSTTITALLVLGMPTGQGQVFSSYGFVLVAAFAGTFFSGRALAGHLGAAVVAWLAVCAINPLLGTPLTPIIVAAIVVMIGWSFAFVTQQARAATERTRAVWQSQIDPFVILEPVRGRAGEVVDLRYVEANDVAVATLGVPRDELLGATVLQIMPGQLQERLFELCVHAIETGEPVILHAEPLVDDRSGTQLWLDVRAFRAGSSLAMTWSDVSEQVAAQEELRRRARTDDLTGFLSRRAGLELLQRRLEERRSGERAGALLFCDLDRFKAVNDSYGHETGDAVLRAVAERVRASLRADDLAIRLGGDEFLVVLVGAEGDVAVRVADKLRDAVARPVAAGGRDIEVGLSVGVVTPDDGEGVDDVVARADDAMYRAKREGRGRVVVA